MTKVIGLDIDGVVLNYVVGFMNFMRAQGIRIGCIPDEVSTYCMSNAFPDLTRDRINDYIKFFSTSPEFSTLGEIKGAEEVMKSLKERHDVSFVAITNAGKTPLTEKFRKINLKHLPFDDITVLPLNSSKAEYLSKLPKGSLYVDDLMVHVSAAKSLGHRAILFRQSYNVEDDHDEVVTNWKELEVILNGYLHSNGTS